MKYFIDALKKYAVFKGRASRKEFWMFYLFFCIFVFLLCLLVGIIKEITGFELSFIIIIYFLFFLLPIIAIRVRRAHDSNQSGWFIIVPVYNLVLLFLKGTEGDNKYGPNPKMSQQTTPPVAPTTPQPNTSTPPTPPVNTI